MKPLLNAKLMGVVDSRSKQGIMARGRTRYKGIGTSPNPLGKNSPRIAKLLLEKRKKNGSRFTN